MLINRDYNFGNSQTAYGPKKILSQEVSPTTITATPAGAEFSVSLLNDYNFFNTAQTGAATDSIVLPDAIPVGAQFFFQAASAHGIQCPTGSSVTLNNVAAPAEGALAANATAVITKVSPTRIVYQQISTLGVVSAPVPA